MSSGKDNEYRTTRQGWLYLLASAVLVLGYAFLPGPMRSVASFTVSIGAACVVFLRVRSIPRATRSPWLLLFFALLTINVAALTGLIWHGLATTISEFVDALGNLLILAAALALIVRRGLHDLGGVIDTSIVALAAGGLLWDLVLLPNLLASQSDVTTRANLFVIIFALSGVLGALLRLTQTADGPTSTLWLFMGGLALGIGGSILPAISTDPQFFLASRMMLICAYTFVGLAALHPSAATLTRSTVAQPRDRLSTARLAFLGVAVALIPVVAGVRALLGGATYGLTLTVNAVLVTALVMIRIGLLSAQRARAEQALRYEAAHDPLTRLPNKREFVDRLARELARGGDHAILFCDLDDFKLVNDKLGHSAGDMILVKVADRIRDCLTDNDVASRFGGDEFLILLSDVPVSGVDPIVQRITDAITSPINLAGSQVRVGASIGVAATSEHADPDELIRLADQAMYRAKRIEG